MGKINSFFRKLASRHLLKYVQRPILSEDQCKTHLPFGTPTIKNGHHFIGRQAYAAANDYSAKIPSWVSYRITRDNLVEKVKRSDSFVSDKSIPKENRSEPKYYDKTHFDKGHYASDADMRFDSIVERECFIMSNIGPQHPNLNRIVWEHLECAVRDWVKLNGDHLVYIISGYDYESERLDNGVCVPDSYSKIIINLQTNEGVCFWFFHHPPYEYCDDFISYISTIDVIKDKTMIEIPLPINIKWLDEKTIWELPK